MAHRYSTKDMCKIFGVGRETLRYYENMGLLHPNINPVNGYREYGYWDVGAMIDILKFRLAGFSLKDTKKAIFDMEFSEIVGALELQENYFKEKITYYKMLERKTKIDVNHLKLIEGPFEELRELELNEMVFIPYMDPLSAGRDTIYQKIFQNSQFFSTAWIFRTEKGDDELLDGLGFITETEFAKYLKIGEGEKIEKAYSVATMLDVKGQVEISRKAVEDFDRRVFERYPNASKETYVVLMSRFYDKDHVYHQYIIASKTLK
jgi:DNA-binding transcriptional MerR regulator